MTSHDENRDDRCDFVDRLVVLDSNGPFIFIGRLTRVGPAGYVLIDADVHDRSEGHSTKEEYINEAARLARHGEARVNRARVFVDRAAVVSMSTLDDVTIGAI